MREIVGVVGDVRHIGLESEPQPEMFVPHPQSPQRDMSLVIRAAGDPVNLSRALRESVVAIDPDQPVNAIRSLPQLLSDSIAKPRFNFLLFTLFAAVALVLAVTGVYGVMSYAVTRRTREIGIRIALGARRGDVLKLVLRQGMSLMLTGTVIGLAGAIALTRLMARLLYGISPTDPVTFAAIALLLGSVATLACYIPARRATKVDPMIALRYE
jgi:putative ABC transport system permease protein